MKVTKVCVNRNNLCSVKNGRHNKPSGTVVRTQVQASSEEVDSETQFTKILIIDNFIFKACLGCFEWIYNANYNYIDLCPVFETNAGYCIFTQF